MKEKIQKFRVKHLEGEVYRVTVWLAQNWSDKRVHYVNGKDLAAIFYFIESRYSL